MANQVDYGRNQQQPMQRELMPVDDPIMNAGKAIWGGVSSLFSGISKVAQNSNSNMEEPMRQPEPKIYYDENLKRWINPNEEQDVKNYDPMTGKVIPPPVTELPPTSQPPSGPRTVFTNGNRKNIGARQMYVVPEFQSGRL